MSVKKFKFVSPGIFINEIDKSQIPSAGGDVGPVVVGRAQRGPVMRPVRVESFSEFVEVFGTPVPGGVATDAFREGSDSLAPTYAAYAAQAWLKNSSPLTFVRLAGEQHPDASATGKAGWQTPGAVNSNQVPTSNAGAYGLFLRTDESDKAAVANIFFGGVPAANSKITVSAISPDGKVTTAKTFKFTANTGTALLEDNTYNVYLGNDGSTNGVRSAEFLTASINANFQGSNLLGGIYAKTGSAAGHPGPNSDRARVDLFQEYVGTAGNLAITFADSTNISGSNSTGGDGGTASATFRGGQGPNNGTLAAVWYLKQGSTIRLSGSAHTGRKSMSTGLVSSTGNMATASIGSMIQKSNSSTFNVMIDTEKYEFDFNRTSNNFVRKVFNTNPTLLNSTISSTTKNYWLGESYEGTVKRFITGSVNADIVGFIAALNGGNTAPHADRRFGHQSARTGWIISQDPRTNFTSFDAASSTYVTKLFRFESLDDGSWLQNYIKVSIEDIKGPRNSFEKYGSFTVTLRKIDDTDNAPVIMEQYSNCNLNPDSENYIARRIGDKFLRWNVTEKKYQEEGDYDNVSKFVRVIMNQDIANNGPDPLELVPFGSYGPLRYKGFTWLSGSKGKAESALPAFYNNKPQLRARDTFAGHTSYKSNALAAELSAATNLMIDTAPANVPYKHGGSANINVHTPDTQGLAATPNHFTGSWEFPSIPLRASANTGNTVAPTDAYFGADTSQLQEANGGNVFNEDVKDMLRGLPHATTAGSSDPWGAGTYTEPMWIFTLDDLTGSAGTVANEYKIATYVSGSRARGNSYTAAGVSDSRLSSGYKAVLDLGYDKFTTLFYGGHSGFDITEREPFRNARIAEQSRAEADNYAFFSVKKAIDTVADPEYVEMDLLTVPGIWDSGVTDHMINVCEDRSDALAVIDLENDYTSQHESTATAQNRIGSVDTAVSTLKNRAINSSYACAFYPWVHIRDTASDSGAGQLVWVPPSVAALGTFGSTQRNSELWFAPAGFNRGGLSEGSSGLRVVNVRQKLTAKERDKLYENNINPIASFPSEGIVIFGQKTLQVTKSALDRINVRRLLIYLKKQISRLSTQVLFDPNVQTTWDRFSSLVTPFLDGVQSRFGLEEYRLVLDETTTTPDLVDQNVLYAKIFLKPTRTIEFIALDFVVANSGASFEDL